MSARCYRVVVEQELGPRCASAFDGMTLSAHDERAEITGTIVNSSIDTQARRFHARRH
jgi:hypothetical protein